MKDLLSHACNNLHRKSIYSQQSASPTELKTDKSTVLLANDSYARDLMYRNLTLLHESFDIFQIFLLKFYKNICQFSIDLFQIVINDFTTNTETSK